MDERSVGGDPGVARTQVGMGWVVPEQPRDPAHLNQPHGLLPTPVRQWVSGAGTLLSQSTSRESAGQGPLPGPAHRPGCRFPPAYRRAEACGPGASSSCPPDIKEATPPFLAARTPAAIPA